MLSWLGVLVCLATFAHAQYWNVTGSLTYDREDHTATLLPNGNVLVAGGYNNDAFLNSAELYNPTTGLWTVTGNLTYARYWHTATLLLNGKVLVAGGANSTTNNAIFFLNSSELYNASTGLWTVTGNLTYGRQEHTATLLPNGNVLVAGGTKNSNNGLNSAEVYNATTGVWTVTGDLAYDRYGHTATLLLNGNALVAAGYNSNNGFLNSAELYNTPTGVWTMTGSLTYTRFQHTATLLPNGNVIVAGGVIYNNDYISLNNAELYNATTGVWTVTGNLTYDRFVHTATLLLSGNVLVAGGYLENGSDDYFPNSAELYNATTGVWTVTGSLTYARDVHTATLLTNGNVLVAGGQDVNGNQMNSAELYNGPKITATATPTLTPTSTSTQTSTQTTTPSSTQKTTPTPTPTAPSPTSSSTSSPDATPTPTASAVSASPLNTGAIAGGIVGGLVGLVLLVLLLWRFRSRYWNKNEIKDNKFLDSGGYSQPMLDMSDVKSGRTVSNVSIVDTRAKSSDDILIPFASLKLGAVLGQGNFGQVFQATYRGGPAAVKKLKGVEKEQIMEEAKMMKSIPNHANVLHYFGVSEQHGEIMMVTELCDKGNLAQYLRSSNNKLTLIQCRQLCCQIASGMWHVSTYGIVHRDLRAENIFLSSTETRLVAKVADFGMARSLQSRDDTRDSAYYRMTEAKAIPIAWTAPEVLTDQLKYVAASDGWSFGVVMWEIYSRGSKPFDGVTVKVTLATISDPIRTTPLLDRPNNCPDDILTIMNSCWAFNPQDRPTFEQLYNQLA